MDDKFLYQNRPSVRQNFSESLYKRLSRKTPKSHSVNRAFKFGLRFALASLLLFVVLFTFSKPVQAIVINWVKEVAGFGVREDNDLPGLNDAVTIPSDFKGTLAEASKNLPFDFSIPTYMPDGYLFYDEVDISKEAQSIFMMWINSNREEIILLVKTNSGQGIVAGIEAAEEIMINGQPVALVHGGYDATGKWDPTKKDTHLYWHRDGLIYILFSGSVDEEELIKIAQSID